ncbi:sulfurtransferase [Halomonas binhaiensis]|uniref:Sulfurtransferase n=1 Tax=Halomonas binhaiensis TaxID=2562282 RepID=A0A5C1NG39_9GAMM|nr:sulfurtransferase [Halomonas binhaiensis]QEM81388.1 sulfurtransferase [Halomonas binhaiensis]
MSFPLIQAAELHDALASDHPPLVLDCRFRLMDPGEGHALWRQGHIPGSHYLSLDEDLSARQGGGRHPLPSKMAFSATLRRLGLSPERPVVVLDDMGGQLAAARAWWMLAHWAGHPAVRLLDGGLAAWTASGGVLQSGDVPQPEPSAWQPLFNDAGLIALDDVAQSTALKVDARAGERFRGEVEPLDPRPGHIPGAVNRPCSENLVDGCFKEPAQLDRELPVADEVIAYCGSGVTACHNLLAYEVAGRPLPRLYVGSWSEWSSDPARPAELGEPGHS